MYPVPLRSQQLVPRPSVVEVCIQVVLTDLENKKSITLPHRFVFLFPKSSVIVLKTCPLCVITLTISVKVTANTFV